MEIVCHTKGISIQLELITVFSASIGNHHLLRTQTTRDLFQRHFKTYLALRQSQWYIILIH